MKLSTTFVAVLVCSLVGCDSSPPTMTEVPGLTAAERLELLTPEAAEQLDGNGFFILPESEPNAVLPQITREQAIQVADRWGRGTSPRRSGAIRRQCGRVLFARSPYEPLDASERAFFHRSRGPYWLTFLCDDGVPSVFFGVAGYATNAAAPLGTEPWTGGELSLVKLQDADPSRFLMTPEEVARIVGRETGTALAAAPELFVGGHSESAYFPRWRVKLAEPQRLRKKDGTTLVSDVLFYGRFASESQESYRPTFAVPLPTATPHGLTAKDGAAERLQLVRLGGAQ